MADASTDTPINVPPPLSPGDRAPNFLLPAADGKRWVFYERVRGNRNLVLLIDRVDDGARGLLTALAANQEALSAHGLDLFPILGLMPDDGAALVAELGLSCLVFCDPQRQVLGGFRKALGDVPGTRLGLLLDPNQRLVEVLDASDDGLVAELLAQPPAPQGGDADPIGVAAPVLIVPDVLDADVCTALMDRWGTHGHEEGKSQMRDGAGRDVRKVDYGTKRRFDHIVRDQELARRLGQVIGRRIAPEMSKVFLLNGFQFDAFVITCYDGATGGYFRPHRDNTTAETQDRLFALTLNLNTGAYEGGALRFPEYGPQLYSPPAGGAILFSCSLIHEVVPVTSGRRFTLLNFLRDPNPKGKSNPLGVWGR